MVAQLAHQVKRLLRRPLLRQEQRVLTHLLLDRRPHLLRHAEKPVGGHQSLQRLVRPLEIVPIDIELQSPGEILEVVEDGPREKLVPKRLPEALDLPQRLRMLRPRLQMLDTLPAQLVIEFSLAPPGGVLPPIIGEDFLRRPEAGDACLERLPHQLRLLVPLQRPAGNEARAVVEKRAQVYPLVPAQKESEDIRLPELVRLRPLEAPRPGLLPWRSGLRLEQPCLVQHAPHFALADPDRLEPLQHIADPPRPVLWVRLPQRQHRLLARVFLLRLLRLPRLASEQRLVAALRVLPPPLHQRRVR